MNTMLKKYFFLLVFVFAGLAGFGQDVSKVKVDSRYNRSNTELQNDQNECLSNTDAQFNHTKHKTLKNTGVGVGAGAIVGKIFGKPGLGAAAGGAAGAYRGHKMNKKDESEFNNTYASCLRNKGYSVTVEN